MSLNEKKLNSIKEKKTMMKKSFIIIGTMDYGMHNKNKNVILKKRNIE